MLNVGHRRRFAPNVAYKWSRRGREIGLIKIHLRSNTRWRNVPLLKVTPSKQQMWFVLTECDGGQVFDHWESKNRGVPLTTRAALTTVLHCSNSNLRSMLTMNTCRLNVIVWNEIVLTECDGGQVWTKCGSMCVETCDNPRPACNRMCFRGCRCPSDRPIWYHGKCITLDKCPR